MSANSRSFADSASPFRQVTAWIARLRGVALVCVAAMLLCAPLADAMASPTGIRAEFAEASKQAAEVLGAPLGEHDYKKERDLEDLRQRLASLRDRAQALADQGTLEARLAQARLDALGPAPAEGESARL